MTLAFPKHAVAYTAEIDRIARIPRRTWQDDPSLAPFAASLSWALATASGTMALRPVQAQALFDLYTFGGLFAPIRVGGGKTLITLLAPSVIECSRPLIVVPAKLRDKTLRELPKYRRHWQIREQIRIESYELISRVSGRDILEAYQPDLIVLDEAHKLKNEHAAVTRRVRRYVHECRKLDRRLVIAVMSGTVTSRSLHDYHHLLEWTIPSLMPLPRHEMELRDWADAIDEKVDPLRRLGPGALLAFATDEERRTLHPLVAARTAYRRRLVETPGVVATADQHVGASLTISAVEPTFHVSKDVDRAPCYRCDGKRSRCPRCGGKGFTEYPRSIDGAFARLRELGETPDGQPVSDGASLWRHARELACGFYYRWNPPPPLAWLIARRDWFAFVREILAHTRRGLDSTLDVANAFPEEPTLKAWTAVRDLYDPEANREPVWIDDGAIALAYSWMREGPGLVWVEHVAFGERLALLSGAPYCSREGKCTKTGRAADTFEPTRALVCSVASIGEGLNMQAWSRNLVISAPPNGRIWEQMIGRTHRDGQEADEVTIEMVIACAEQAEGFKQARLDAEYQERSIGQAQKLLYADLILPDFGTRAGARWTTAKAKG